MPNLNVGAGKAGNITLMKNGANEVTVASPHANSFSMSVDATTDYAMSQGSRKVRFDSGKEASATLEFDVFSMPLLSVMFSMNTTVGSTSVFTDEYFLPTGTTISLAEAPVAGSIYIAEVQTIDKYAKTGNVLVDGDPANVGEYSISGTDITINAGDSDTPYRVFYMKASAVTSVSNKVTSLDFPVGYTIAFDTVWKGANDNSAIPVQIIARNAVPQVSTSLDFSEGSHATVSMNLEFFPDSDDVMFEMIEL